jgi:hypothetical protein
MRNIFLKIFACRESHYITKMTWKAPVASADYASFVITKTRDVCFTGSLVEHQLSMEVKDLIKVRNSDVSYDQATMGYSKTISTTSTLIKRK